MVTRTGDNTITITPRTPHSAVVVVMHGLGDTADGFEDVAMMWSQQVRGSEGWEERSDDREE